MKTIKDAVIELDGKWPSTDCKFMHEFLSKSVYGCNNYGDATICTKEQFESTAKRMGYINGYLWGKEYPTNGKRPDLADDVLVLVKNHSKESDAFGSDPVKTFLWEHVSSFKITDPRYKPTEEVSEISESKSDAAVVSEKSECKQNNCLSIGSPEFDLAKQFVSQELGEILKKATMKNSDFYVIDEDSPAIGFDIRFVDGVHSMQEKESNWHERGELPPVGIECEGLSYNGSINEQWLKVKTLDAISSRGDEIACVEIKSSGKFGALMWLRKFRPLTSEKERRIEMAKIIFNECGRDLDEFISALDAEGMLVLPQNSGDTEG